MDKKKNGLKVLKENIKKLEQEAQDSKNKYVRLLA